MTTHSISQLINAAVGLHRAGGLGEAERIYRRVLQREPTNADALNLLGVIERQRENYAAATALLQRAITHGNGNPNLADFYNNLGECQRAQCHFDESLQCYEEALKLRPDFDSAIYNKGNLLQQTSRQHEAIACYERALKINPGHHKARFAISISELLLQDFRNGWLHYQRRQQTWNALFPVADVQTGFDAVPEVAGKRILLVHEQGLGDELFFLRFVPRLREMGADISYWPSAKLRPLLAAASTLQLADAHDDARAFDHRFAVGDAALLAGMQSVTDIPPGITLTVPANLPDPLAGMDAGLPRPWVGISWRAGTAGSYFKQMPLTQLLQIFRDFGGTLFVMQRHPQPAELALIRETLPDVTSIDCSDLNDDLLGALHVLNRLDHYLCVSNTNLHLRAALRRRCDVLLPIAADFRWPRGWGDDDASPWFPDVAVYRQASDGSWEEALAQARAALPQARTRQAD